MKPKLTHQDNFIWLLVALLALLLLGAFTAEFEWSHARAIISVTLFVTMLVAVWSLREHQGRWLNRNVGITLVMFIVFTTERVIDNALARYITLLACIVFFSLTLHLCWRQVLARGAVDVNRILGAICIYILLGIIWALLYLLVEEALPGSFEGLPQDRWQINFEDMIYYSMVTLTTLGYGDIVPTQPLARCLAYFQAITGIFFSTILVASLVGMRLMEYSKNLSDFSER